MRRADIITPAAAVVRSTNQALAAARDNAPDFTRAAKANINAQGTVALADMKAQNTLKIGRENADVLLEIEKIKRDGLEEAEDILRPAKRMAGFTALVGTLGMGAVMNQQNIIDKEEREQAKAERDAYLDRIQGIFGNNTSDNLINLNTQQLNTISSDIKGTEAQLAALGTQTPQAINQSQDLPINSTKLVGPKSKGWKPLSYVISYAEGTLGDRGYTTQFTGTQFTDLSKHPRQLRSSGRWKSDAAGKYQFLSTTWDMAKGALGLQDFSPQSQELAGRYLTQKRGVDPDAVITTKEQFKNVMDKLAPEWASLPYSGVSPKGYGRGSSYHGQGGKSLDELWEVYLQAQN